MTTKLEIKKEFEALLSRSSNWKRLIGSQFVDMFSTFIAQVVERITNTSARRLQESFLSLATRRSSILAAAEDRAYVGLKISPSTGTIRFTNKTDTRVTLPEKTPLISQDLVEYILTSAVLIKPREILIASITQQWLETITTVVETESTYLSVLLPQELTAITHRIDVLVNGELWEKRYKFRNTNPSSRVYMEYYKSTEQLGIRFGDGINGAAPSVNSVITLNVWCTSGDSVLIDNQPLQITGRFEHFNDSLDITTETPITGGAAGAGTEDIRNGALYSTTFDNQIAWDSDYEQFIKDHIGGIVWLSVWGEKQQEELTGKRDIRNINNIFISAYSNVKTDEALDAEIIELFNGRSGYNEIYRSVDRIEKPFTVHIKGRMHPNSQAEDAKMTVYNLLESLYGKDVKNKPSRILIKDLWASIEIITEQTGIIEFELTASELPAGDIVGQYSYIDMNTSSINFSY